MGSHFHSNSKALWETEPLGSWSYTCQNFSSHGNRGVWGGDERSLKLSKGPLAEDNV